MAEKYKIEVSDECVEIMGTLTIREAFDFLNFYEREGYTTLEDWGERTTLYLRKRDLEQERSDLINEEVRTSLSVAKDCLELEKIGNQELRKRVEELESLIRGLMSAESDKVKSLLKKIDNLEKTIALMNLKYSKEAAEICKMPGPDAQENPPFSPLSEGTVE